MHAGSQPSAPDPVDPIATILAAAPARAILQMDELGIQVPLADPGAARNNCRPIACLRWKPFHTVISPSCGL